RMLCIFTRGARASTRGYLDHYRDGTHPLLVSLYSLGRDLPRLLRRRTLPPRRGAGRRPRLRAAMSEPTESLSMEELREAWPVLSRSDRIEGLHLLPRDCAEDLFFELPSSDQADVVLSL